MLDVWCDAACDAVSKLGFDPSKNEGFDLANMVLFSIMKCDLYRDIFQDYIFEHGDIGQSRIQKTNHDNTVDYFTAYDSDVGSFLITHTANTTPNIPEIFEAIALLPNKLQIKMTAPPNPVISLRVVTKSQQTPNPAKEVTNASELSYGDFGHLKNLFGHIYFSTNNNEDFVIAENLAGVVGIVSLFRHEKDGKLKSLSISGITVTPSYRERGIATALCVAAAIHAKNLEIPLMITSPSEQGKSTIYKKLTQDICYKDSLVFEPFFYHFSALFDDLEMEYKEKVELLNWFKIFVDKNYTIDYSNKYFDDRSTMTSLKSALKQQALYIRLKSF